MHAIPFIRRSRFWKRSAILVAGLIVLYVATAYLAAPALWVRYARRHPSFDEVPRIARTGADHPGDPLNVSLIGTEREVKKLMVAGKWYPADPLTLRSCLEIAEATVLKRHYEDAPVSNLYLFGRKQDLAFEQLAGANPRHRHHVRFWRTEQLDEDGRPVWMGAATYDRSVGFSHATGQITHHIDADVDAERDYLFRSLDETGRLSETYAVENFHLVRVGKNGGGDPWHTDGRLYVGVVAREE